MNIPLHVAIDARPLSRNTGGIRRYLDCLLEQMLKDEGLILTLYSDGELPKKYYSNNPSLTKRIIPRNLGLNKGLWEFYVYKWMKKDKPDLFWSPRHHVPWFISKNIPLIVTVHDVVWKSHPRTLEFSRLINEIISMPRSIRRANKILSPSQATCNEITRHWPLAKNKISVIQHGATIFPEPSDHKALFTSPYFLTVGTIEPRKNYIRLIQAFDIWCKDNKNVDLVIVGQTGWGWKSFRNTFNLCRHHKRIHLINDADDAKLANLYRHTLALIQVSLSEGFGMPIAEARQFGLPLLLSDIPVFRELVNHNTVWVDPNSTDSILKGLTSILKIQDRSIEPLLPTWQKSFEMILSEFRRLVEYG